MQDHRESFFAHIYLLVLFCINVIFQGNGVPLKQMNDVMDLLPKRDFQKYYYGAGFEYIRAET